MAGEVLVIIRPLNEPRMIEIRIAGISLKNICYYINGIRHQFIQIGVTFILIVCRGLPGKCLYKSDKKCRNGAPHHFPMFRYFYKDMFLEVPDEKNK